MYSASQQSIPKQQLSEQLEAVDVDEERGLWNLQDEQLNSSKGFLFNAVAVR